MKFIATQVPIEDAHALERAVRNIGAVTCVSSNGDGTAFITADIRDGAIECLVNNHIKANYGSEYCPRLEIEE
jgi:hypothetical protein